MGITFEDGTPSSFEATAATSELPEAVPNTRLHIRTIRSIGNRALHYAGRVDRINMEYIIPYLLTTEQHQQAFILATITSSGLHHFGRVMHSLGDRLTPAPSDITPMDELL